MRNALVVHQDADMREALVRELGSEFHVKAVRNRDEAMIVLARLPDPGLLMAVVVDLDRGNESLDLLREVRLRFAGAVRVLISTSASDEVANQLLATRVASCFARHPWSPGMLLAAINNFLGEAHVRVLVADQDPAFCEELTTWLSQQHQVTFAHDGEEALRLARQVRPSVVLVEFRLPKLAGPAVAWTFAKEESLRQIPLVYMTQGQDHLHLGRSEAFLTKPFSRWDLLGLITHLSQSNTMPATPISDSQRLTPRQEVDIPARLVAHGRGYAGTMRSLSPRGAYVETDASIVPGTPAWLSFATDVGSFEGGCEVRHSLDRDGQKGLGVFFFEQPLENQELILRMLKEQEKPKGRGK